jgi:hypothetical protein
MIKRDEVNGPFGLYENGVLQKSQGFYATRELAEERKQILLARGAESRLPQPVWFKVRIIGEYTGWEVDAIRAALDRANERGITNVGGACVVAERVKP